jgi:hypothetical protein
MNNKTKEVDLSRYNRTFFLADVEGIKGRRRGEMVKREVGFARLRA